MIKHILQLIICLSLLTPSYSQDTIPATDVPDRDTLMLARNAIYLELAGTVGLYSVNYERMLWNKGAINITARAGFSIITYNIKVGTIAHPVSVLPITFSANFGRGVNHLETGTGLSLVFTDDLSQAFGFNIKGIIGYRFQKPEGGFLFRIGYTPIFGNTAVFGLVENSFFYQHWGGVSAGYSF